MKHGPIRIGVVADIIAADTPLMIGQGVYSVTRGNFEKVFSSFETYARGVDFVIGNFEAVLVPTIDRVSPGCSAMKSPLTLLPMLKRCGFRYLSVANNHAMEYGPQAYRWMCDQLDAHGIQTFGHKVCPWTIFTHAGSPIKIGLFGFSTVPAMYGHTPENYYVDATSRSAIDRLVELLKEARSKCDHLLVFPHWGNEFMSTPAPWQVALAERMVVESRVSAILGAHPHCMQTASEIRDVPVYFSMGHLLSDFFQERIKKNIVVELEISEKHITVDNRIFSCDDQYVIYDTGQKAPVLAQVVTTATDNEYWRIANETRRMVRRESMRHLACTFHRWAFNRDMWRWLVSRALYLVKNARKIRKDPNVVYSGPIH